jgi:hypothetical protein
VKARPVMAAVAVMRQPHSAADMPHQYEHMMATHRHHAGGRFCPRETQPVRRQIERWDDPAENMERSTTATERAWAALWTTTDNPSRSVCHNAVKAFRDLTMMPVFRPRIGLRREQDAQKRAQKDG